MLTSELSALVVDRAEILSALFEHLNLKQIMFSKRLRKGIEKAERNLSGILDFDNICSHNLSYLIPK